MGQNGSRHSGSLGALAVSRLSKPGRYRVSEGLYVQISENGSKSWLFRYQLNQRKRVMGLGSLNVHSLAEARNLARECQALLFRGIDPIEDRKRKLGENSIAATKAVTFKHCCLQFLEENRSTWSNPKHRAQWESTLRTYCYPVLGETPVSEVSSEHVIQILKPIWVGKNETAIRLRGRIETILNWAKARRLCSGENPASMSCIGEALPKISRVKRIKHYKSLPYDQLPSFVERLRADDAIAARALEFAILTASRTTETLQANWSEVDIVKRVWSIPPERMKMRKLHRVPLSDQAMLVLDQMHRSRQGEYIFPGRNRGRPLSGMAFLMLLRRYELDVTAHGFRATFKTWAAEQGRFARELVELSLAHANRDQTEQAYLRTDLLELRRPVMQTWADFCSGNSAPKAVAAENTPDVLVDADG